MRVEQIHTAVMDHRIVRAASRAPRWVMPLVKLMLVIADGAIAGGSFALGTQLLARFLST